MSTWRLDRRRFLTVSAVAGARMLLGGAPSGRPRAEVLRIAFLQPPLPDESARQARLGARFGAEEGARTAALFGRTVTLAEHAPRDAEDAARSARAALDAGAMVLVGGFGEADCAAVAEAMRGSDAAFLNVGCASDVLRGTRCAPNVFHVAASEAMRADALAAARAADPGVPADATVELWHPTLERFGAAQLGDRFRARHGAGMTSAAWAGWFAVKAATDAVLRARGDAPLASSLAADGAQFDGHKGVPLSFRSWDHQLRQPLYVVHGGRVLAELPGRGAAGARARELLDAYGTRERGTGCRLSTSDAAR